MSRNEMQPLAISPGTEFCNVTVAPGSCHVPGGFVVESGDMVGVSGKSGVGKSVFLRFLIDALQRVHLPVEGVVDTQERVKYVPQDLGLLKECSLATNARVVSGQRHFEVAMQYLPDGLRQRFSARRHWSPATLSGGERRMFVLSCALSSGRGLLLLDEILVSLDQELLNVAVQSIQRWLRAGRSRGCVIVTHDSRVLTVCNRAYSIGADAVGRSVMNFPRETILRHDESLANGPAISLAVESLAAADSSRRVRLQWFLRLVLGSGIAILAVLAMLQSTRWFVPRQAVTLIPTVIEVANVFSNRAEILVSEGGRTVATSLLSLLLVYFFCSCYWLIVVNAKSCGRGLLNSILVGMQAIPILVLAPLFGVMFGLGSDSALVVVIGVFIAVFPMCLTGARQLSSVQEDLFRATGRRKGWGKFSIAVRAEWGSIIRIGVACAPLAAVGVVVGEYIVGRRGVGNLVFRAISSQGNLADRWGYAIACVGVAVLILLISAVVGAMLLPKDVAPE